MFEKELDTAITLARKASLTILDLYALEIIAEEKYGVDNFAEPVTAADRIASRMIVEGLAEAFPTDGILSEEETDVIEIRSSKERVWMVDPIDGTSGFIRKDDDFAVQIGLADKGEPVVGVVMLPAQNTLYYAAKDSGAFAEINDSPPKRLHVSDTTDFKAMEIAVSRNHRSPKLVRVIEEFGFRREIERGSVGLKTGLVSGGRCDLYLHLSARTKFWDTCGPQIILEEAGGKLTDIFGFPIKYDLSDVQNHNGILATNGTSHGEFVKRLSPILYEFGRERVETK